MRREDIARIPQVWDASSPTSRHEAEGLTPGQQDLVRGLFQKHALDHLPEHLSSAVEWGSGGGLLAEMMEARVDHLVCADISGEALLAAAGRTEADCVVIPPNPIDYVDDMPDNEYLWSPEWVNMYSVIFHMPNLDYYKQVAAFIGHMMNPKYVTLQTFVDDKQTRMIRPDRYFDGKNHLRAMIPNLKAVPAAWENYDLTYARIEDVAQPFPLAHFILERKA